jgi:hypothetical protein
LITDEKHLLEALGLEEEEPEDDGPIVEKRWIWTTKNWFK